MSNIYAYTYGYNMFIIKIILHYITFFNFKPSIMIIIIINDKIISKLSTREMINKKVKLKYFLQTTKFSQLKKNVGVKFNISMIKNYTDVLCRDLMSTPSKN